MNSAYAEAGKSNDIAGQCVVPNALPLHARTQKVHREEKKTVADIHCSPKKLYLCKAKYM